MDLKSSLAFCFLKQSQKWKKSWGPTWRRPEIFMQGCCVLTSREALIFQEPDSKYS